MANLHLAQEWFRRAETDLSDAQFLFDAGRDLENVALLIQQAVEKYLKGFLLYHERDLEKIHDLYKLLQDAIAIDDAFELYADFARNVSEFYFESRYPLDYEVEYTREEIKDALRQAHALVMLIRQKIGIK